MEKFFTIDPSELIGNKIDKERLTREAYPKAEALLKKFSIKEESFRDMYGSVVDEDKKEVSRKEEDFSKETDPNIIENKKLSEIFNAIILEQFEMNEWMGKEAFTTGTSKYDKFRTGISNITEFHNEKGISYMAMAIRATFSANLGNKLSKIKENIKNGELSKIKYFESDLYRGELKKVPSVIVGCNKEMLLEVIELWLQNKNKKLSKHPIQFLILDQVNEQVEFFKKEAFSLGKYELVDRYKNIQSCIGSVLKNKESLRKELENPENDNSLSFKENHDSIVNSLKQELKKIFES